MSYNTLELQIRLTCFNCEDVSEEYSWDGEVNHTKTLKEPFAELSSCNDIMAEEFTSYLLEEGWTFGHLGWACPDCSGEEDE